MPIRFGETHPSAKLNTTQVLQIKYLWDVGHRNIRVIAKNFGVSPANVKRIVNRETWKHLEVGK